MDMEVFRVITCEFLPKLPKIGTITTDLEQNWPELSRIDQNLQNYRITKMDKVSRREGWVGIRMKDYRSANFC